jgi:hypothetical protein
MRYDVVRWSGGRRQRPLRVQAGISLVSATAVGNRRERVADSSEGQSPGAYRGQEYMPRDVFALRLCLSTSWSLESANAAGTLTKLAS